MYLELFWNVQTLHPYPWSCGFRTSRKTSGACIFNKCVPHSDCAENWRSCFRRLPLDGAKHLQSETRGHTISFLGLWYWDLGAVLLQWARSEHHLPPVWHLPLVPLGVLDEQGLCPRNPFPGYLQELSYRNNRVASRELRHTWLFKLNNILSEIPLTASVELQH